MTNLEKQVNKEEEAERLEASAATDHAPEAGPAERPSIREVGRERIEKFKGFFSKTKDWLGNKASQVGNAISRAGTKAKELGIASVETAMATPEIIGRGAEYAVGAGVMAYETAKEGAISAKNKVVEAKNYVVTKGKENIEKGFHAVKEAKDATIEFGNSSMYRLSSRISKPFLEFQNKRLASSLRYMSERIGSGKVSPEKFEQLQALQKQLDALMAM